MTSAARSPAEVVKSHNMTRSRIGLGMALACVWLAWGADLPPVNDGGHHGDPPFLLEDGWRPLLNGKNLDGWKYRVPANAGWITTRGVVWGGPASPVLLTGVPGPGDRIVNSAAQPGKLASDLMTVEKFGDVELYLEFMVADQSNSGVFLNSQYEIQIWDSYGRDKTDHPSEICGTIYNYVLTPEIRAKFFSRPPAATFGATGPKVRAERPTGHWQSFQVWFQAPRFDAAGKKTANARFLRVLYNGVLIQENVEREGRTLASLDEPEAATNPLLLQGDHGPVAFRNIYIRPLRRP